MVKVIHYRFLLGWDYGLHTDISNANPLMVKCMEWSAEGYQLWLLNQSIQYTENKGPVTHNILQLDFVKSALTVNPCMVM